MKKSYKMEVIQFLGHKKKNTFFLIFFIFISTSAVAQLDSLQVHIDSLEWKLQLKEVTVVGQKKIFERKIDRLVFNVENSIINSGSNAMDALRITPGITVQNDQISMMAKSGTMITIDDRIIPLSGESLVNYIRSISSASIKSIEVITTPPAKYDAEGNSGIINIVLKKTRNNSWNLNLRGAYTQATYPEGNVGADFNFKKNKLSVYSSLTTDIRKTFYEMKNSIFYPSETWVLTAPFTGRTKFINGNVGVDYDVSSKWKIGAMYFSNMSENVRKKNSILTTIYDADNISKEYMNTLRDVSRKNDLNAFNIHSIHNIDTLGKKISIDVDYFTYNSFDSTSNYGYNYYADNSLITNSYYAKINQNDGKVINYSVKIHVDLPLKLINFSFGGKVSLSENNNNYKFYDNSTGNLILDNNQTNTFRYREEVQAFYMSANKQITKYFKAQIGLRFENTITDGYSKTLNRTTKNDYLKLFPTCYLIYQLNEEKSIVLNYSRRINRPPFIYLNPYRSYFNSFDYNEGNPFLAPSFSNNFEIAMNTNSFEHKLWYNCISDDYFEFPFVDVETKIVRHYPLNCINYQSAGISESYQFSKFWWWNSYNSGGIYYMRKKATIKEAMPLLEKISGKFFTNNDFAVNKKKSLMFNLGFYYEFPYLAAYNNISTTYFLSAGVKLLLLNKNMTLSLTSNDIFRTNHAKSSVISDNTKYVYDNYGDSQNIRLYVSYKIGNDHISSGKRNVSNKDERDRVQ